MPESHLTFYKKYTWPIIVVVLSLGVAAFIFKQYLLHPNHYLFAFGGDPFVIYYDMLYHVSFDQGTLFKGMNYPYGEYIFLTDAQGAFSTLLQWINRHLLDIRDDIPGIIHGLNIYLLPVCSLMVFYILRHFEVRVWLAAIFAVLVTFLSPAILRTGNHFGLAYPFVIPMAMLWYLRKYKYPRIEFRDGLVLTVLIFFTFNNPYIGFTASGFLLCTALVLLISGYRSRDRLKSGVIIGFTGAIAALLPFLIFHFNDPVHDRLRQQWGFFYYNANFAGLFFPPFSLLYKMLTAAKVSTAPLDPENNLNVGLVNVLLFALVILYGITGYFRKTKWIGWKTFSAENLILFASAFMMFLLAANRNILPLSQHWMEHHIGAMLMFKASARLGWPAYFAIAVSSILFLDQWLKKIKSPVLVFILAGLLVATWVYEINGYVSPHYQQCFNDNFLKPSSKEEMLTLLRDHQIHTDEFQAMLVLPKMMAWNDDFLSDLNWAAQFYSMRISAATGLPMISSMLSRMSVGQCAEAIQLLADPLVHRDLVVKLPNQKDILLLVGSGYPSLAAGEQYLIDVSTPLYESKDFSLYRLRPDTLLHSQAIQKAQQLYSDHLPWRNDVVHLSFDQEESPVSFYGPGARRVYPGQTLLVDRSLPVEIDTQYVFSAWSNIDYHRYGVGAWHLVIQDSLGQTLTEMNVEPRRSNDIQDGWIRAECQFTAPKGCRIQATLLSDKELYVDEVFIYPLHANAIADLPGAKEFLLNGYKISKPVQLHE